MAGPGGRLSPTKEKVLTWTLPIKIWYYLVMKTRNPQHRFANLIYALALGFVVAPALLSCSKSPDTGLDDSPEQAENGHIYFELPDGWTVETNDDGDSWSGELSRSPSSDSPFDDTLLTLHRVVQGTDGQARETIESEHAKAQGWLEDDETTTGPSAQTLSDEEVWSFDWTRDDAVGLMYTTSIVSFEKNGWVVLLSMNDAFDSQEDALARLVSSIRFRDEVKQ